MSVNRPPAERGELVDEWRKRADRLDGYARTLRREGITGEAEDAESAAIDYRLAADELEAQLAG